LAAERHEDERIRWTTVAMAIFATTALEQAVLEPGQSRAVALGVTIALLIVPVIAAARFLSRQASSSFPNKEASFRARAPRRRGSTVVVALLMLFAFPLGWQAARLVVTGGCSMLEVTLLAALRNLGLGLAAMSHRPAYARLSALVSLFLVTVASPVGGEGGFAVLAPVGGFGFAGTLWLLLVYWNGLGLGLDAGTGSHRFPLSGVVWVLAVTAVVAALAAALPSRTATALAGLMPTSGGTDWSDPEARAGVGDGDNEVSGSEHPESVGFTESDIYLETDRPSLYDAFNESYGKPLKPKKQEKMIALGQQDVREQEERPAENLQAGREFSAVRSKPEPRTRRASERAAKALVYVKGPTPLHLPLTSYSHFDGTAWREQPCCDRYFPAEPEPQGTWLRLSLPRVPCFGGSVAHQVKIGTLESSSMPVPAHPIRFRVGSVNRLDYFGWAQFGIIRMTDRTVPAGTVIDSENLTVDPERLESLPLPARPYFESDHELTFHGEYAIDPRVSALAREWVRGLPEGWRQVQAVIAELRKRYTHDRSATVPADCKDVVAEFLLRSGRGPDYLFASSAVALLRSLGYPTRLVSGLYAAPWRFDSRTRHTPVTSDDVHFWAEVRLPGGCWIAVEPTPGYELLPPVRDWFERIARALLTAGSWALDHAAGLLSAIAGLGVLVLRRRDVLDRLATIAFELVPVNNPRRCVMRALRLIELRGRWAGRGRPPGLTLARWYHPIACATADEPRIALESLVCLADWSTYAPTGPMLAAFETDNEIRQTCRAAVKTWTLSRFRQAAPSRPKEVATT
jgi:protein-glutamine gamma-glutamyltransferase